MSYVSDPGKFAAAVVPSDATVLAPTRALWIGSIGNLTVTMAGDGATVTFLNLPVGIFPIQVTKVLAATTAGAIVAMW
jgi:hypothetical protein